MTARPKRVVIYVRLSRHRGAADPSTSPERQEEAGRAYCLAKGWEVADVVHDLDESGSDKGLRLDRPGLQRIRAMWADVDVVLFAKLDRLARSVVDFHVFAAEAKAQEVDVVSVAEGLDLTTASGRFAATILAAFAEMEAATIAERTRDGLRAVRAQGRWAGGTLPFGYRAVPAPGGRGKVLEASPEEAAFIREAAQRVLGGASLTAVVRWANGPAGLRPRRAQEWTRRTLTQVLTGTAVRGQASRVVKEKGKPRRSVPVLDAEGRQVTWDQILTPDDSAALRRLLTPSPDPSKGGRHPARLLSGLLVCHDCGERLQVARRTDGSVTYRCQTAREAGRCAQPVSISATALEDFISRNYLSGYGRLPAMVRRAEVPGAADLEGAEQAVADALEALAAAATTEAFQSLQAAQERLRELAEAPPTPVIRLV
ncbi:MAG: recombinase family protein, partial [Actinomycetota bacterium]|nr:recombinase family protein [Actinomycetota bacterium]